MNPYRYRYLYGRGGSPWIRKNINKQKRISRDKRLLRVFDEELGEVVEEVGLKMLRDGPYWSLLVRIELEPGRSYTVEFTYGDISLKSRINS